MTWPSAWGYGLMLGIADLTAALEQIAAHAADA